MQTLTKTWADGWAISRSTPAPVEVPEGFRIDVGRPNHAIRYVLPAPNPALAARLTEPGTWLKICAGEVQLDSRWQIQPPEYLMSTRLTPERPAVAPEYGLEVKAEGGLIDAVVLTRDGEPAARGRAALTGEAAVIDQVITEPDHRRRGLGTTVMQALTQAATRRGATTGVLVATADGLELYSRLDWTVASPVTAAVLVNRG